MDPVREAFQKIKQDLTFLNQQIQDIKNQIQDIKNQQNSIKSYKIPVISQENIQTIPTQIQRNNTKQTDNPTDKQPLETIKSQNIPFSMGNEGVPTDRQTNQQTDNSPENSFFSEEKDDFEKASKILDSLDNIKKEIRLKFKKLTPQEMLIFSTLYTFEDRNIGEIDYKLLANHLKLSESSIRDYVIKLIRKGIPIQKTKQNNKKITLSISNNLKKTATLSTIMQLRDL